MRQKIRINPRKVIRIADNKVYPNFHEAAVDNLFEPQYMIRLCRQKNGFMWANELSNHNTVYAQQEKTTLADIAAIELQHE